MSRFTSIVKRGLQWITAGKFLSRIAVGGSYKAIYLTFDDGPDPEFTLLFLDTLDNHDAKATFFLIGEKVAMYPNIVKEIISRGHAVAGHTFYHQEVSELGNDLVGDLDRTRREIFKQTGCKTYDYRPVRGKISTMTLVRLLFSPYRIVHWSITFSDYRKDGVESLLSRIRSHTLEPGDILLFHDDNPFTLGALDDAIKDWKAAGFQFRAM